MEGHAGTREAAAAAPPVAALEAPESPALPAPLQPQPEEQPAPHRAVRVVKFDEQALRDVEAILDERCARDLRWDP